VDKASKIDGGLPGWTRSKMMANVSVDAALQFIPFVGDIAAAFYKSNARNCAILEKFLIAKGSKSSGASHPTEEEYELASHPSSKSNTTKNPPGQTSKSGTANGGPLGQAPLHALEIGATAP
jgi:hypothetical protein